MTGVVDGLSNDAGNSGFEGVDLDEIFKPGYTTKDGGSGYGLFLARRIMEEHGGRIHLGQGANRGGVVELWLPAAGPVAMGEA